MSPIEIDDVMDEIGDVLDAIPGLRVHREPADSITPPAAEVLYPDVDYDRAFQRGLDRMNGGIIVSVSPVSKRGAKAAIARYASGSGPQSVHAALHARTLAKAWTSCSFARVIRGYGVDHTVGEVAYVAYRFDLDIAGPGS